MSQGRDRRSAVVHGGRALGTTLIVVIAAALAVTAAAADAATTEFSSSFEASDRPLDWANTAETDAQGNKKTSGVTGSSRSGIPGSISDKIAAVTASADNPPNEAKEKAFDGSVNTKWLVFANTGWLQAELSEPVAVVDYALTSANDAPGARPQGLDAAGLPRRPDLDDARHPDRARTSATASRRGSSTFANTTAYRFYRLDITANHGDGLIQLAELQLSNGDTTPPPPSDMKADVSSGPVNGPNMLPNAGFTGMQGAAVLRRAHRRRPRLRLRQGLRRRRRRHARTPSSPTRSSPSSPSRTSRTPARTPRSTSRSATAPTSATCTPSTSTAPSSARTGRAPRRRSTPTSGTTSCRASATSRPARRSSASSSATTTRAARPLFNGWVDDIAITGHPSHPARPHLSDWAVTTRGTNSSASFSRGNNFPATAVPHGFNFWTPETDAGSKSWLYEYQRANNADNLPTLQAFAAQPRAEPVDGRPPDLPGDALAASGVPDADREARALAFSHDDEVARPYYYGVTFAERPAGRDRADRPRGAAALLVPRRRREPDLRQRRRPVAT